jgi:uncharacterized protein (TIGR03000 family)
MRHKFIPVAPMRKWRRNLFGGCLVLLSVLGTDLPKCRGQLEFNGGYVQTHREDHGEVPRLADLQRSARSRVNLSPSYSPDSDLYYRSFYPPIQPTPAEALETAVLIAHLPENAVLWVEGTRTRSTGRTRYFLSPPLTPGRKYRYRVRVAWIEHGQWVSQTQIVPVQAGAIQMIDFPTRNQARK